MKIIKTIEITLFGLALLAISLTNGQAQTTATWIGPATGGEWNTGTYWDTGLAPADTTTNAIIGPTYNVNYYLPMAATGFGALTNQGVLNVNTNGFNNNGIVMLYPGGTGKLYVNTGGVVNVTGNLGFDSNSVVNMSVGSSVTLSGSLYIGSGTNGGSGGSSPGNLGVMTNNGGYLSASGTSLNPANGSVGNNLASLFVINGGTNNLGNVYVGRASGANLVPLGNEGLVINGGFVNMTSLLIGNNAWGAMLIRPGATVTNTGDGRLRMIATASRPARLYQSGGLFVTAGTNYLSPTNGTTAAVAFSVTGGTNYSSGFQFGEFTSTGIANFTNGAVMYVGGGGIASNGTVTVNAALNSGGLFGATANWTGSSSMTLNGINGVFTFQTADADGTVHNITLTGGLSGSGGLNKTGGGTLHLGATNTYSGNTLINAGTLAVDASGSLTSPLIIVESGATFDVSAVSGGFVLKASQTLSGFGSGSVNGIVTTAPTTGLPSPTINPGSNTLTGTLTFQNDLVEQGGAINHFDLSGNPSGTGNDFIIITSNLTVSGINTIETGGAPQNGAVYKLIQYGTFNGDLANFTTLSGTLSNSVANKIIYLIAQSNNHPPTNVTWLGNSVTNNWDMLTSTNWSINGTGPATNFVSGDNARFDNTGASYPLVNIVGGVLPGSITVDSTFDYTFIGAGSITGGSGLTKTNSGELIVLTTNSYTGITTINGGILAVPYLANGSSASAIGIANSDPANLVINNGTLSYFGPNASIDRGVTLATGFGGSLDITNGTTLTESGTLTGDGGLTKAGQGTLNLTGNGAYTGTTTLSNGTLQVNGPTTIGSGEITFAGGTLTVASSSSQLFYNNTLDVASTGTLNMNGANGNNVLQGAWAGSGTLSVNIPSILGYCTLNHDMTTNFTGTILLTDTSLGAFRFNSGGNSSGAQVCTGSPTATFDLGNSFATLLNRNGGGTNGVYYLGALAGGTNTALRGSMNASSASTYQIGGKNIDTTYSGAIINGTGGTNATVAITKVGTGTLTLNGDLVATVTLDSVGDEITNYTLANPIAYTGPTTISNGVLALITPVTLSNSPTVTLAGTTAVLNASQMGYVSNQFDSDGITVTNQFLVTNGLFEVYSGQTLAGIGTIRGQMLADSGSTLNVGLPTGSLTVTNGVELAGTVNMNVNAASSPNSSEIVSPSFTIDGTATLTVTNIGPENAATFQLFSRAVSFAPASVTLPTLTGTNSWVNNLAYDGSITLVAPPLVTVNPNSTNVTFAVTGAGNTLTLNLSWPADHIGWRLLEQTNPVTVGLVNNTNDWFVVTNATTTNQISMPINVTNGTAFFRLVYP